MPNDEPYSGRDWPEEEKKFASMVTRLDRHVGRIMTLLDELKLDRDTVVFFASDNGGVSGEGHDVKRFKSNGPFRREKATLYEGGIRVPMIVRWPGRVAANTTSDVPWRRRRRPGSYNVDHLEVRSRDYADSAYCRRTRSLRTCGIASRRAAASECVSPR